MLRFVFLTIIFIVGADVNSEEKVKYYRELLNKKLTESRNFQLPVDNREFLKNSDNSTIIYDYGRFDFIVVGAGSTGAVIATRLSENKNFKVLLIEAGGNEDDYTDIPGVVFNLMSSDKNWGYLSTPQKHACQGMKNKQCSLPRGKIIGGCSTVNGLSYVRGNKNDYDKWEELGNPGWSYKDVLPYFKKSENSLINGDIGYHNKDGLWTVDYTQPPSSLEDILVDGNKILGRKYVDINGADQMGFERMPTNIKNGKRQSTGRAFLDFAKSRENLNITLKARATKILINEKKEAYGVEFMKKGKKYNAFADHEVIISAGSFNSPQLLMLSGIGPMTELQKLGINVVADLPVGKHLKDHVSFYGLIFNTNMTITAHLDSHIRDYVNGKGILTKAGTPAILGFVNTQNSTATVPDIEYVFLGQTNVPSIRLSQALNLNEKLGPIYDSNFNPLTDFSLFLIPLHPKSEGKVSLNSKDPADFPNIDVAYYTDEGSSDLEVMYQGVQFILNITKTHPFQKIGTKFVALPICKDFETNSKQYWYCYLKQLSSTLFHPIGTCRMGRDSDSVVDYELKVHGIKFLRVADCSIFPSTISGHTSSVAVMVGEKLSDMIKSEYQ